MDFYTEPAFFMLLLPIVGIAVVLGLAQKPLARYGFAVSVAMLVLLFSRSLASLAFLGCYLLLSCLLMRWVRHLFASKAPHAVGWYRVALALQIAPLAVYKVGVVFDPSFLGFLGISYITFKAVQVLIETRDGLIEHFSGFEYLYFLIFFPTFTSGPIMRSRKFAADIDKPLSRDAYLERLYRGAGFFILGAVYKFVFSAMTAWLMWFAPSVIGTSTAGSFVLTQVVYALCYGLNLFFDFAGYSHMAVGVGMALGIEVPRNFRAPFLAVSIKDFWNRWHITLSWWLRDFVFMRFSAAAFEHRWFKSPVAVACVGFILNMTLMGAWHGLTVPYLVYGLFHGVLLALCELMERKWGFYKRNHKKRWFKVCSWAVTMVAVFFSLALFSGQVFNPVLV